MKPLYERIYNSNDIISLVKIEENNNDTIYHVTYNKFKAIGCIVSFECIFEHLTDKQLIHILIPDYENDVGSLYNLWESGIHAKYSSLLKNEDVNTFEIKNFNSSISIYKYFLSKGLILPSSGALKDTLDILSNKNDNKYIYDFYKLNGCVKTVSELHQKIIKNDINGIYYMIKN